MVQKPLIILLGSILCAACATSAPRALVLKASVPVVITDSMRALSLDSTRVWRSDSVEQAPELLSMPKITKNPGGDDYPASSRNDYASQVVIRFILGSDGVPEYSSIRALTPSDPRRASAAMRAIAQARFRPATIGGRPVRVTVNQPFNFPAGW